MTYNPFSLTGKTILVTGASSGIGRATAIECSRLGARLILVGRNKERLEKTILSLESKDNELRIVDLATDNLLVELSKSISNLDGIVLCAGITKTLPAKFNSTLAIKEIFDTNTFANISLLSNLLKYHKIKSEASVVLISSVASNRPYKGNSLYSASKGALNSYSRVLAVELAHRKIRVNTILPGIVKTEMLENQVFSDEEMQKESERIPLDFGTVGDIAKGCLYLLSNASKWVTGTEFVIDGGQSLI